MQEVEHSIDILKNELEEEKKKYDNWKSFVPTCKQLLEIYWTLTPDARNAALKEVIDRIEYKKLMRNPKGMYDVATLSLHCTQKSLRNPSFCLFILLITSRY